ncbi:MAG: hypothetical protein M1840_000957 [Geoglossum simile]|nr:MAG: hypothetical protein M1840_000957 [Geoglossum simile]
MADVTIHKQEFLIKDLATRSVTLYPARANVVRDINDVCLKPGANEITIYGLTPTADEHSVKVDGRGTATITDMTVDLVPNRDIFEDVYPSDTEDPDSDSDSEMEENDNEDAKKATAEFEALKSALADAREEQNNASRSLSILDHYGNTVHSKETKSADIAGTLKACFTERQRLYQLWKGCQIRIEALEKDLAVKKKEQAKLQKPYKKRVEKFEREKSKKQAKKQRQKAEQDRERMRLKEERKTFWPKKVYRVILHLDAPSLSSHRESLIDLKKPLSPTSQETITSDHQRISLSLSYITYSASWSPRYDLLLTTPSSSGTLVYRASFKNTTSETWRDAKIVLSTSQTSYQGLGETVPHMGPWHVSLAKGGGGGSYYNKSGSLGSGGGNTAWGGGLYSIAEQQKKEGSVQKRAAPNRNALFGLSNDTSANLNNINVNINTNEAYSQGIPFGQQMQQMQQQAVQQQQVASRRPTESRFSAIAPAAPGRGIFRSNSLARPRGAVGGSTPPEGAPSDEGPEWHENDGIDTLADADPSTFESLQFQESSREDYGMTTTYDVPGLRTLPPSDSARRHKIAEIPLHGVQLSYILVPKLRPAAFLKARIRNTSLITLLRGQAGLTLDGTFLGNTTIPRCSAGETFVMPLGVDPSVHVSYAKPTVRRSSSGVFSKEDIVVYTRTCWITNTKPTSAVDLRLLDQIPVSEDERLRISVIHPKGLKNEGDSVRTGWDASSSSAVAGVDGDRASVTSGAAASMRKADAWGNAVAALKKSGEVCWDVTLSGGRGCKLVLEYEARIPGGEGIVGIDK